MNIPVEHPKAPPIIDIEASGFGKNSYPIEIGYVLEEGQTYCTLIQPMDDWIEWNEDVEAVHGITRSVLNQHGKPAVLVAEELNQNLQGMTLYTDAWSYDSSWISLLFYSVDVPQKFRLESLRMIISEEQTQYWHQEKERIIEETNLARHRASSDALIIQKTYSDTFDRMSKAS